MSYLSLLCKKAIIFILDDSEKKLFNLSYFQGRWLADPKFSIWGSQNQSDSMQTYCKVYVKSFSVVSHGKQFFKLLKQ